MDYSKKISLYYGINPHDILNVSLLSLKHLSRTRIAAKKD